MEPQHIAVFAVVVATTTAILFLTRRRVKKSQSTYHPSVRERYAELQGKHAATRDHVEQTMLQLDQLARQINAQLDTRFAKIEVAIADADRRIEELTRLARPAGARAALDVTVGDAPPGDAASGIAPGAGAGSNEHPPGDNQHRERIYQLADEGLSGIQISHEVGQTRGEVELILALRKIVEQNRSMPQAAST